MTPASSRLPLLTTPPTVTQLAALSGQTLTAPEVIDLEVVSVLRRQVSVDLLDVARARFAVADLLDLPLQRVPHLQVIERCWDLRHNLTVYDASYVALAELLDLILVTGDLRLAKAPGLRCSVEVVG